MKVRSWSARKGASANLDSPGANLDSRVAYLDSRAASSTPSGARNAALLSIALSLMGLSGCAMTLLNGASGGGSASTAATPATQDDRTASQTAADDAITTSVRSRLKANPALKPFNLAVDTHDGVVTLRGEVAKAYERNAAQLDARAVKGVKSVTNLLRVR